jgi:hypothetical protein
VGAGVSLGDDAVTVPSAQAKAKRKLPWIVWRRVDEPGHAWYRVANYATKESAQAAVPGWRKLYEDAGMPRLFLVAER